MKNPILEKYKKNERSLGTFMGLDSTAAALALGEAGLDFVVIDAEHGAVDMGRAADYVQLLSLKGTAPLVRINTQNPAMVQQALDAGALGIIVPRIASVKMAEEIADLAKFPPEGSRGFGPSRDSGFMKGCTLQKEGMEGYMAMQNRKTMVILQCETAGCLKEIEQICALKNVDGIMIGPYDLSISMGMAGQFDAPEFQQALARVRKACKDAGKPCMIFTGNAGAVQGLFAEGYDSVIYGVDTMVLIDHYRSIR